MRGSPRIASDHRPATNGVVSAKTPSAINRAPAMRFLITPEIDGIGIYPCSINARILTKPLLKRPAGQSASRARSRPAPGALPVSAPGNGASIEPSRQGHVDHFIHVADRFLQRDQVPLASRQCGAGSVRTSPAE